MTGWELCVAQAAIGEGGQAGDKETGVRYSGTLMQGYPRTDGARIQWRPETDG